MVAYDLSFLRHPVFRFSVRIVYDTVRQKYSKRVYFTVYLTLISPFDAEKEDVTKHILSHCYSVITNLFFYHEMKIKFAGIDVPQNLKCSIQYTDVAQVVRMRTHFYFCFSDALDDYPEIGGIMLFFVED